MRHRVYQILYINVNIIAHVNEFKGGEIDYEKL